MSAPPNPSLHLLCVGSPSAFGLPPEATAWTAVGASEAPERLTAGRWDAVAVAVDELSPELVAAIERWRCEAQTGDLLILVVSADLPASRLIPWLERFPGARACLAPPTPAQWHELLEAGAHAAAEASPERVRAELERLARQATIDPLTGLLRREEALRRLDEELLRARRTGQPLACAIADIDHFKRVNDLFGHPTGDRTLHRVAALLNESRRPYDLVGRLGGEEFILVFPSVTLDEAVRIAERMRLIVQEYPWRNEGLPPVTISAGVAELQAGGFSETAALTLAADEALYEAKRGGRNQVRAMIDPRREARRPPPVRDDARTPVVLAVDDTPSYLDDINRLLGRRYRLASTTDPREALAWAEARSFDLALIDENMPAMKGHELLARLKLLQPECVRFIMTRHGELASAIRAINECEVARYILKPWNDEELLLAVHQALEQRELARRLRDCDPETIRAIAEVHALGDRRARGHYERVGKLCAALARAVGLPPDRARNLLYAAWLHDIGKAALPRHLSFKQDRLTPQETKQLREHPRLGAELVASVPHLAPLAPIILHHHERYDGLGYPDGLAGEAIPLEARLLAVADGFDRLMHPHYAGRATVTPETALAELRPAAGSLYDPRLVDALEDALAHGVP